MNAAAGDFRRSATRFTTGVLRAGWPGTRVLKSALASGLAWSVANRLGDPAPLFAVFGALNAMQPTVAGSLRNTSGALLGIVLGTALAVASETFVDAPRAIVVALVILLGLLIALRLNAYAWLGTEVAVTGLLVFALSQGNVLWALGRLGETALGGGIAILINALILPPDYQQDARRATETLVPELALRLRTVVQDVIQPPSEEEARAHLLAARDAARLADELVVQTARAEEALRFSPVLRYSPLRPAAPAEIERYTAGVGALALGLAHVRTAARAAGHHSDHRSPPVGDWGGLAGSIGPAVIEFARYVLEGGSDALERAAAALRCALEKHAEVVSASRAASESLDMDRAVVLAEAEHVLDDLHTALRHSSESVFQGD